MKLKMNEIENLPILKTLTRISSEATIISTFTDATILIKTLLIMTFLIKTSLIMTLLIMTLLIMIYL
jgi:hypothetical protein